MLLVLALVVTAPPAVDAAKAGTCNGFAIILGGQRFTGDQKRTVQVGAGQTAFVDGTYVEFLVDLDTFTIRDYTLTGVNSPRPDKDLPIDVPTVVFVSKVPNHGDTLNSPLSLELSNEGIVLDRSGAFQDMKL
jgi:hypothetical protein